MGFYEQFFFFYPWGLSLKAHPSGLLHIPVESPEPLG